MCDDRREAERAGTFRYVFALGAWVFEDGPRRTMSAAAQFRAFIDRNEYDHPKHMGEPWRYVVCPWCDGDLPHVKLDAVTVSDEELMRRIAGPCPEE